MDSTFCILLVMCRSTIEADKIASELLKKRIVACASVLPGVTSKFWWNGKINKAREVMLIIKTKNRNFKIAEKEIKLLHSYEIPEIIAVPITAGSEKYLRWIGSSTKS